MRPKHCQSKLQPRRLSQTHRLVHENIGLARRAVGKHSPRFGRVVHHDDLLSVANEALVHAATNFQEDRGMTFSSYAYGRIVGSMIDHVRRITRSRNRCSCAPVLAADKDLQAVPDHNPDPERATLYSELRRIVHSLPARQQHLLIRHYFEGEHLDVAGQEIGISKTTASNTLASDIATLRLKLEAPATLPAGGRHTLSN